LATPGKLVAEGSPVTLKSTLGEGYSVQVKFDCEPLSEKELGAAPDQLLAQIQQLAPEAFVLASSPHQASYHLRCKDSVTVEKVLKLLDNKKEDFKVSSYDVLSTSIEDIFLRLMTQDDKPQDTKERSATSSSVAESVALALATGRPRTPWKQALTIFYKRALVARRSWLAPLLAVLVAVFGSTIPLFFMAGRKQSCTLRFDNDTYPVSLYLPTSDIIPFFQQGSDPSILTYPPDITSTLGLTNISLKTRNSPDNMTFVTTINQNFHNLSSGGISLDLQTGNSMVAWEASPPGMVGPAMLNLATNILLNNALNVSGRANNSPALITPNYESFPFIAAGVLVALKWVTFFGAAMVRMRPSLR
jgi:ATP-binding cassette, subfamily A (ABC1), member 3